MSEQAASPSPGAKTKRKKKKKKKRKNNVKPGSKPLDVRDLKSSVAVDAGGASTCTCHFTRAHRRTNCNAESAFLRNFEDRIVGAINGSAELLTEWAAIVTRGKEYLTRFANLLLESEQLEPAVFAETMAETHGPLSGNGSQCRSVSVTLRDLSSGKRAQILAAIQQDLFGIHDRLAALQRRRAAAVRLLAEDVDCCLALELQGCLKPGVLRTTDPIFKTLGLIDFYRLLAKISAMYEQELVLKQVKTAPLFVLLHGAGTVYPPIVGFFFLIAVQFAWLLAQEIHSHGPSTNSRFDAPNTLHFKLEFGASNRRCVSGQVQRYCPSRDTPRG